MNAVCSTGSESWFCVANLLTQVGWPFTFLVIVVLLFAFRGARSTVRSLINSFARLVDRAQSVKFGGLELEANLPKELVDDNSLEVAGAKSIQSVESAVGGSLDNQLVARLRRTKRISEPVSDYPYLIHQGARVTKSSRFPYIIKVWLEFDKRYGFGLDEVARVYYRLDSTFPEDDWVLVSDNHARLFEVWMRVFGEFTIIAVVVMKDGREFWLSRYLDLPGRPAD